MPVTIGELVDVPSPLSLLASPWAQEVSERVVHRYASIGALAAWNYAPDGSLAYVTGASQLLYVRRSGAWVPLLPTVTSATSFATTTARDTAIPIGNRVVGMKAMVGTVAGTGTAMPREYVWDGTAWAVLRAWGATGRLGVSATATAFSIPNNVLTDISFGVESWDNDGWITVPSTTFVVPAGHNGIWNIFASMPWSTGTLGTNPFVIVQVAGSTYGWAGGPSATHSICVVANMVASQTIKLQAYQNSGGTVTISPRIVITPVSP